MSASNKSSRNRKSAAPSSVNQTKTQSATPATTIAQPAAAPVVVASTPAKPGEVVWAHDYDYIYKDLRKLLIVSLSLFAAIIILGFFV